MSQGANKPGGEQARRRTGKGAKKPDTLKRALIYMFVAFYLSVFLCHIDE